MKLVVICYLVLLFTLETAFAADYTGASLIKLGMKYHEVVEIMKSDGRKKNYPSVPTNQEIYLWECNSKKEWISVWLEDGLVASITASPSIRKVDEKFLSKGK